MRLFIGVALAVLSLVAISETQAQQAKIVGGTTVTDPDAYPFIVALVRTGFNPYDGQQCAGTLVHPKWVVTAAHCVYPDGFLIGPSYYRAYIGGYDLQSSPGELRTITRVIAHPSYNTASDDYDIALLELSSNSTKTPIWLSPLEPGAGVSTRIIGWGATQDSNGPFPTTLQQASVPTVSNDTCNVSYSGQITSRMFCAGYPQGGTDTCQGDSGGPVLFNENGSWKLGGIVSWGIGCALPGFYGVNSRISEFGSWIASYVPTPYSQPSFNSEDRWGLWNGFINMWNIAEIVNDTPLTKTATVYLAGANGAVISVLTLPLAPFQQYDLILNNVTGFEGNTYGVIRVAGGVAGRVFTYRPRSTNFSDFDFAYGVQLIEPQTGTSYVSFNTYQPSNDPVDGGALVSNWLSLVNTNGSDMLFTVERYNQTGDFLSTDNYTISAWGRQDVQGGHQNPGPSNVGFLKIIPGDSSPYLSQLVRYGYRGDGNYGFAFPLIPQQGETNPLYAPLSTMLNAQNWLELVNVGDSTANLTIRTYGAAGGTPLSSETVPVAPRAQYHFNASAVLGDATVGHAEISTAGGKIVSQSMHYARTPGTGGIEAAYAIPAREAASGTTTGSYNLFLNMYDFLKVINTSGSTVTFDLTISGSAGPGSSRTLTLNPHASTDLGLHEAQYGSVPDSYGTAVLEPHSGAALGASIIRFRYNSTGLPEFIAPTDVR